MRSWTSRLAGAQGVLFAQGARFGGHTLYVKDNRLHYGYNFAGMLEQKIDATEDVPVGGSVILSASFDKDGEDPPGVATGVLSLYHGDKKVAVDVSGEPISTWSGRRQRCLPESRASALVRGHDQGGAVREYRAPSLGHDGDAPSGECSVTPATADPAHPGDTPLPARAGLGTGPKAKL